MVDSFKGQPLKMARNHSKFLLLKIWVEERLCVLVKILWLQAIDGLN